jgi:hypothetical protein
MDYLGRMQMYFIMLKLLDCVKVRHPVPAPCSPCFPQPNSEALAGTELRAFAKKMNIRTKTASLAAQLELAPTNARALSNVAMARFILSLFALRSRSFLSSLSSIPENEKESSTTP